MGWGRLIECFGARIFRKAYNEGEDEKHCFEVVHDLRTDVSMAYERALYIPKPSRRS